MRWNFAQLQFSICSSLNYGSCNCLFLTQKLRWYAHASARSAHSILTPKRPFRSPCTEEAINLIKVGLLKIKFHLSPVNILNSKTRPQYIAHVLEYIVLRILSKYVFIVFTSLQSIICFVVLQAWQAISCTMLQWKSERRKRHFLFYSRNGSVGSISTTHLF